MRSYEGTHELMAREGKGIVKGCKGIHELKAGEGEAL